VSRILILWLYVELCGRQATSHITSEGTENAENSKYVLRQTLITWRRITANKQAFGKFAIWADLINSVNHEGTKNTKESRD